MALRKFIIERDIPKVGTFEREQLRGAAAKSNEVLHQLGPDIQWVESYVADNMMLCGDAAGQVIPLTGAGIHTGLVAGKIAGEEAAISALSGTTSAENLKRYRDRFDRLWGHRISNSLRALDSFERFSDSELNVITGLLEGQDLVEMANGFSPTKAVGLMARHPLLAMKVAYQLLTG